MDRILEDNIQETSLNRDRFFEFLVYIYFAITFFEPYLNGVLGSVTKYYIFAIIMYVLFKNRFRIRVYNFHKAFLIWLLYLFVSLLWTDNYHIFRINVLSQVGMIGLLIMLTMESYTREFVENITKVMWLSSFIISFLAMFFGQSYRGGSELRQVLVLFGQEADPNNQAAFALIGLSIALYFLIYENKYKIPAIMTIAVNSIAMFLTGSRGGLVSLVAIAVFVILFNPSDAKLSSKIRKTVMVILAVVVVWFVLRKYIPEDIVDRLLGLESYAGGSERTNIWNNGLELLSEDLNIIFGAGWGCYFGYNGYYTAMHNTYLAMLCNVGVIGFLIFFVPIFQELKLVMKKKEYLPVLLIISGFCPSFFLDAINKRFFWNVVMFLFIYTMSNRGKIQ
nr:O-antigen ligase family protein [uncultured Sellimonas sp.]